MSMDWRNLFKNWLDDWQLITFNGIDGGDTCANEYTAAYVARTANVYNPVDETRVNKLLVVNGVPIRHPDPDKWYSSTNRTSRDQLTPHLCYLVACSPARSELLLKLAIAHAKHLFLFTWNTRRNFQYPTLEAHQRLSTPDVAWNYSWKLPDFCFMDIWSLYLRAACGHLPILGLILQPILSILDFQNFLAVCWALVQHKRGKLTDDLRNLTLKVHCSARYVPTVVSVAAWLLWSMSKVPQSAHNRWWTKPGEPPLHLLVERLFANPLSPRF